MLSVYWMRRCGLPVRFLYSASFTKKTNWDPTVSLSLEHPCLILVEKCSTRDHFDQILAQFMRSGLICKTFPMSRLLFFSAISHPENLDKAMLLFNHFTPLPNVYIYNTMISALSLSSKNQSFGMYNSMLRSCMEPDKQTLLLLLQSSKCLPEVKQIHCHAIITGLMSYGYFQNSLIKVYLEKTHFCLASKVFKQVPNPDTVTFNILITGLAKKGYSLEALDLFTEIVSLGLAPDQYTITGGLISCGRLGDARLGKSLHAWIERRNLIESRNLILGNALLDMYVKCMELDLAQNIFNALAEKDAVTWNTIIAGYAKVGNLELAHTYFDEMSCRDLVSWNSLIAGYARKGDIITVRSLFESMVSENIRPDNCTLVNLVSAAAEVGALDLGRLIHGRVVRMQMKMDIFLASSLIDMYCKCGTIERAFMVFNRVAQKDVTLWTTMIAGLAFHGFGKKALELFHEMQEDHVIPNEVTFVAVLTACSHSGLVDEGLRILDSMVIHGVKPGAEHYGCLVDLLGRSGKLLQAKDVIERMPIKPSRSIWGALLSACRAHKDVEIAEMALKELISMEPEEEGGYILLSNIYAACGKWKYSDSIREIMEIRGLKKTAGCSSLVICGVSHNFTAADKQHSRWNDIESILMSLTSEMNLGAADVEGFLKASGSYAASF